MSESCVANCAFRLMALVLVGRCFFGARGIIVERVVGVWGHFGVAKISLSPMLLVFITELVDSGCCHFASLAPALFNVLNRLAP